MWEIFNFTITYACTIDNHHKTLSLYNRLYFEIKQVAYIQGALFFMPIKIGSHRNNTPKY